MSIQNLAAHTSLFRKAAVFLAPSLSSPWVLKPKLQPGRSSNFWFLYHTSWVLLTSWEKGKWEIGPPSKRVQGRPNPNLFLTKLRSRAGFIQEEELRGNREVTELWRSL